MKNNKKFLLSGIVLILITLLSGIMVSNYNSIYKNSQERKEDGYNYNYLEYFFPQSNIFIFKKLNEVKTGKEVDYKELYNLSSILENEKIDNENSGVTINFENGGSEYYQVEYDNIFENIENSLKYNYKNLEYYIMEDGTKVNFSNSDKKLSLFVENKESEELQRLKDSYSYYKVVHYDANGKDTVLNSNVDSSYVNLNEEAYINDKEVNLNPKNVTLVYGVAKDLKYSDDHIYQMKMNGNISNIVMSSIKYLVGIFAIMIVVSLFISYKKVNEDTILGKILNWPLEILIVLFVICGVSIASIPYIINYTINNMYIIEELKTFDLSEKTIVYGVNVLNIIYWMLMLLATFGVVQVIKYIFGKGLFKYFRENTITGIVIVFLIKKTKGILNSLSNIDLKEDSNKIILKIVAVNFVVVSLFCVLGVGVIIGTLLYSIGLFYLMRKYINEMKGKYKVLLNATNKIAEGDLDFEIEEDLKIFEPVKKELKKIQSGFKKAVEEEVKSQNMKSELITNVSHDLKTPLTSIITYVDLLKQENITEEERRSYIETIDKKSKRLKTLIEDLFEVSKATSKDVKLDIVNLDIIELIKQVEVEFNEDVLDKNLNIKWINSEEKVILPLDSQKTFRVFENLIGNITKYSMMNSRVYIEILNNEDNVVITLKNISETEINYTKEEIIERFNRGDKSRNTEGSGLGLAIAKNFIELQNGEFNINLDGDLFKVQIRFNKENKDEVKETNDIKEVDIENINNNDYMDADYIEKEKN